MASLSMPAPEQHRNCNRKLNSLALLCSRFLALYNGEGVHSVGLNDASMRLGVKKRRIYDIVNVLESVGILRRSGKNKCDWEGFAAVPQALEKLKEEGLRKNINVSQGNTEVKTGNRKENSLGLLAQNFIKLFVCTDAQIISREDCAKLLLGNITKTLVLQKTKERRLYDIANVLSSLNLVEKTHTVSRKPAYRWLGCRPNSEIQSSSSLVANVTEAKARIFGADITNISVKRNKIGGFRDNEIPSLASDIAPTTCSDHDFKLSSNKYTFGPFPPVRVPKVNNSGSNRVGRNNDWDNLVSTHRPQYHNEALRDLFGHYMEAWKSWHSEVAGQKPTYQAI